MFEKAILQTDRKETSMNVLNRVVTVLLILALLALAVALLIMPTRTINAGEAVVDAIRQSALFASGAAADYALAIVGLVILILLILLVLELRSPNRKTVRIRTDANGKARIGVESVVQSLAYRIDELPGVRDAKPHVTSRGNDVSVSIDLHTSPSVNVPAITAQIVNLAHEIIETQLGVKIHDKIEVNVAHEPFPRGTMAPGPSTPAPGARPQAATPPRDEADRVVIPPVNVSGPRRPLYEPEHTADEPDSYPGSRPLTDDDRPSAPRPNGK
jgi:hypothetical protein